MKRTQISEASKEQIQLEKERKVRIKVMKEFNLSETDFDSLEDFRKYQEKAEDVIFAFLKDKNSPWAEEEMKINREKYKEKIAINLSRLVAKERQLISELRKEKEKELAFLEAEVSNKPKEKLKEYEGNEKEKNKKTIDFVSRFWQQFSYMQPKPVSSEKKKMEPSVEEVQTAGGFNPKCVTQRMEALLL
eukprot:snap_masked-scaffold_2-processed-gene-1.15-mRNA-1 protein AED:1.00 eAED:1.00 QI:0/-1/0/0/-1/1/1/0/189